MNILRRVQTVYCFGGGAKPQPPAPIITPAPPTDEASVELVSDEKDEEKRKKGKTSKGELKIPLAVSKDTGLNI